MYAPFNLAGKVCLVTGGSRGIGFAIADAMAQSGADVAIWSSSADCLTEAAERLRRHGTKVLSRPVDVRCPDQITEAMRELVDNHSHLDAAFLCAGTPQPMLSLQETSDEVLEEMFAVHAFGTFWTLKSVCRQFEAQAEAGRPGGSIVGVSSLAASFGAPCLHAYSAAKGSIPSLIRSAAVEMAKFRVRANTIVPGWIETDLSSELLERSGDKAIKRIPAQRFGQPEDLAGIAVYLASDASSYHSGDTIVIDGGYSIR